ncbi:hypothetical protein [Xanthovirga aplysinae]|uniref:hypothetical protein n=1 Tax=Xanthovirga aplysinae TaxID=2529853 RepID=UPI0012BCDF9F|nr:hypothetical protein [Xanthovirga aplysinae]MTI31413.1 hypothetical protein [Xanthovirga aplysinae]
MADLLGKDQLSPADKLEFERLSREYEQTDLKLYLEDVQHARDSNVEIQKAEYASKLAKNTAYILDFVIVVSAVLLGFMLFFVGVPKENEQLSYIVFGALLTHCGTIIGFHRGSSKEKEKKGNLKSFHV